mmetsp:Transcript_28975/g.58247  ORF Transcript_28975/g.58247 Transcript_28975/m.58247 type:complete len:136 (+) Transcript_28975:737-1144(+)
MGALGAAMAPVAGVVDVGGTDARGGGATAVATAARGACCSSGFIVPALVLVGAVGAMVLFAVAVLVLATALGVAVLGGGNGVTRLLGSHCSETAFRSRQTPISASEKEITDTYPSEDDTARHRPSADHAASVKAA